MSAKETIFNILRKIREATSIITVRDQRSADPLVALSAVYDKLFELQAGPPDILFYQVETEVTNSVSLNKICERVKAECQEYHSVYLAHQKELDRWCSLMTIIQLVVKQAEREFSLRIHCAIEEKNKSIEIFNKYNDITRLYNSRDDNSPISEEDMRILDQYREELYDLVGHPIRLETVNDEHDKARAIVNQKWDELEILNKQKQSRAGELQGQITQGVILGIDYFVENLSAAFIIDKSPTSSSKRGAGRPTNRELYEENEITDIQSSFSDYDKYMVFEKAINSVGVKSIDINATRTIYNLLMSKKWLKSVVQYKFFTELLLVRFSEKCSYSNPESAKKGSPDSTIEETWIELLGMKNE